jgi:hypothetical protein
MFLQYSNGLVKMTFKMTSFLYIALGKCQTNLANGKQMANKHYLNAHKSHKLDADINETTYVFIN